MMEENHHIDPTKDEEYEIPEDLEMEDNAEPDEQEGITERKQANFY